MNRKNWNQMATKTRTNSRRMSDWFSRIVTSSTGRPTRSFKWPGSCGSVPLALCCSAFTSLFYLLRTCFTLICLQEMFEVRWARRPDPDEPAAAAASSAPPLEATATCTVQPQSSTGQSVAAGDSLTLTAGPSSDCKAEADGALHLCSGGTPHKVHQVKQVNGGCVKRSRATRSAESAVERDPPLKRVRFPSTASDSDTEDAPPTSSRSHSALPAASCATVSVEEKRLLRSALSQLPGSASFSTSALLLHSSCMFFYLHNHFL